MSKSSFIYFSLALSLFLKFSLCLALANQEVEIGSEIQRLEDLSVNQGIEEKRLTSLFIEGLRAYQNKNPLSSTIQVEFRNALFSNIQSLKFELQHPVSEDSIVDFVQWIETKKQKWKKFPSLRAHEHSIKLLSGYSLNLSVFATRAGIFVDPHSPKVGSGISKEVFKVYFYENGLPAVRLFPIQSSHWVTEKNNLQMITNFKPNWDKVGLIQSYLISDKIIFQEYFSRDLFSYFLDENSPGISIPWSEKLSILNQLTLGVVFLHGNGIFHGDLKPENAMMKCQDSANYSQCKAVYIDFGVATLADSMQHQGRFSSLFGTPQYLAPEVRVGMPVGSNEDLLKIDVFSHAMVADSILGEFNIGQEIFQCGIQGMYNDPQTCKKEKAQGVIDRDSKAKDYSSWKQLILSGLRVNPIERISSVQFLEGVSYLQAKYASGFPLHLNQVSATEAKNVLQDLPGFKKHSNLAGDFLLFKKPIGTYFLSLTGTENNAKLQLSYVGRDKYKTVHKILDVQPNDLEQVKNEIHFLENLGVLGSPIN